MKGINQPNQAGPLRSCILFEESPKSCNVPKESIGLNQNNPFCNNFQVDPVECYYFNFTCSFSSFLFSSSFYLFFFVLFIIIFFSSYFFFILDNYIFMLFFASMYMEDFLICR